MELEKTQKIQEATKSESPIGDHDELHFEKDEESSSEFEEFSSDNDLSFLEGFNENDAFKQMLNLKSCVQVVLDTKAQQEMGLEVGVGVTSELPWKQVKKEILEDYMPEVTEKMEKLKARISNMNRGELLLVGYAPSLSEDTFLVFDNERDAKDASEIIRKMEAFQRSRVKSAFVKYPKHWKSKGSEQEVDVYVYKKKTNVMDVEVQSIYPIRHSSVQFTQRLVDDVRDGYVELIPGKTRFDNILRKRIDTSIQSAPPRVELEQQTDPTFPTNAWSQYLYEIISEENDVAKAGSENDSEYKKISIKNKNLIVEETENITVSDQVQELLNTLEFNTIDMYRNDYPFIAEKDIKKFHIPYLQESFCFADISKSSGRLLCSLSWHPILSGMAAVSYTFSSLSTVSTKETDKIDTIRRAVLETNPVLLWSFDDTLDPKLQLQSPREVLTLSFCPYDENLVIGGLSNGQIIIWDLKNRISKVETEEVLTPSQTRHRAAMRSFLEWTKEENRDVVVLPAAVSALNQCHKAPITCIQWMNRSNYISTSGQIRESIDKEYRVFVTSSLDGTILFWDLDMVSSAEIKQTQTKKNLPEGFLQEVSEYKKLDRVLRPTFILIFKFPISGFLMDEATFKYQPENELKKRKIFMRVKHKIQPVSQANFRNIMTIGSFMGKITNITWDGFDFTQGTEISKEEIQQKEEYDFIHDGPVVALQRSPFIESLFLSIGRTVFAIWKDGFMWSPILWRKRPVQLTNCLWSRNRPGVFFLGREDGSLEAWDFIHDTGVPCLVESLGGKSLTCLSQHNLSLPREVLGIGNENSNLRIILISSGLVNPMNNEKELVTTFIEREVCRKSEFDKWKKKWYNENKDIIEARKRLAEDTLIELERLEKEMKDKEEIKQRLAKEEERKKLAREAKKIVFDLPERLEKKWDEMNFRRLMRVLMAGKMVDPQILAKQTKPQKDLMKYNEKKKEAIKKSFAKINEDIATVRSRLLPTEQFDTNRNNQIVTAQVIGIISEARNFKLIEIEALEIINSNTIQQSINYSEILSRGKHRREIINKSLGGNTLHRHLYKNIKINRRINVGDILREKSVTFSDV